MHSTVQSMPNYLLVGAGPFAQKTYIPYLKEMERDGKGKLKAIVEVNGMQSLLLPHGHRAIADVEFFFVPPFTMKMPSDVSEDLNALVDQLQIDCVVISTEPLAHKAYGLWAMSKGLNVIMDKPITTRVGACTDPEAAAGIAKDYDELLKGYEKLQQRKKTCYLVQSHRRYHPGFQFLVENIKEYQKITGCPITSLTSTHCDGMWRMPREIIEQDYHTFKKGYGKLSHSGYHLLDICSQFLKASWSTDTARAKMPDRLEVVSSFITPGGFLTALNHEDYKRIFGAEYSDECDDEKLAKQMDGMGEIDCAILMTAFHGSHPICLAQMNLLHSGFSRRSSVQTGPDLYKGVGRVKHESHDIKCGPFQTIVAETRKAEDNHASGAPASSTLGGENHFDVHIFRNHDVLKTQGLPVQSYTMDDIMQSCDDIDRGDFGSGVKRKILEECSDFMAGRKKGADLQSNLLDHQLPAHIMSAAYLSHVRKQLGQSPVVTILLNDHALRSGHPVCTASL